MTPIKQTILSDRENGIVGNCWQACVASLLDLSIDEVPHFCDSDNWPLNFYGWLKERGLACLEFKLLEGFYQMENWGYHLISGPSPRNSGLHGVVGYNGEIAFDPHPDNTGLLEGAWVYTFIFPIRDNKITTRNSEY